MNDESRFTYHNRDTGAIETIKVLGHRILLKRCRANVDKFLVGNVPEGVALSREADMMIASMRKATPVNWCEVVAIGDRIRQGRTDADLKPFLLPKHLRTSTRRYSIPKHINVDIAVGDMVACKEVSEFPGTQSRGLGGWDHFVFTIPENLILVVPAAEVAANRSAA